MSRKPFSIFALVALAMVIARFFHFHAWRMADGPQGAYPQRPFSRMHPWHADWSKPSTAEAEPDAEGGDAE
jgi:hypothetical protein